MINYFNKKGFTLVELIIVIALMGIIIAASFNILLLGTKTHSISLNEYDLQSSIRIATESVNQIVRYSKAVFAVPGTFVSNEDVMDPDWNYFMVSNDGKKIVSIEYDKNKKKFIERIIVSEQKDIVYEVFFEKNEASTIDNLMRFIIKAFKVDKDGKKVGKEKVKFETTVESINAVQVVDKGTGISKGDSPSVALAYRNDGQSSGKGRNDFAYISLIVDISGSMNEKMPTGKSTDSRINLVKKALTGYNIKDKEGIIQQFGKEENIYMSFVPFSLTANYPNVTANTNEDKKHEIYEVYNEKNKNELVGNINKIVATGGTNTGDALRRAYYLHENFRSTKGIDEKYPIHHYMILLVDGKSTYDVKNGDWNKNEYFKWNKYYGWQKYYGWDWTADVRNQIYYMDDGNIKLTSPSNHLYTVQQSRDPEVKYSINGTGLETSSNLNDIGTKYIEAVGKKIKTFKDQDEEGIKSYIIGYAKYLQTNINSIGTGIGTEKDKIYSYDDPDFDINEVFQDIANDIMADFWIVAGPQIQK